MAGGGSLFMSKVNLEVNDVYIVSEFGRESS